ncbi:putative nucleoside-diphosphate-sugar epimerase [Saccharata proteae CBS 121410]|uniref:Putative nucleoside-diphosphate-sugar epimerase n=1 Tax=Saccharata proteae CBS 121410 TaxID=1314787 RepID=A0A6A5YF36_9PEZI|nr:putative nucleoside-diphosphate-sugar epimerase [Saccharata proteae CBS 121410]
MAIDYGNDLVLLTCASGKQCSHLLPLLYGKCKRLRLVVNSTSSEERLKEHYPQADVTRANLMDFNETKRIMKGVTTVFHIGPSFHPHETEIGYFMVDAAAEEVKNGNLQHFIYSSVLNTQLRKMMNHDCKRYVEEYLMESGLNYTILQPTHFMDLFPVPMLMQQEDPVYTANWDPTIPFSFIALKDLAEAAAIILKEREKHYLAQYPMVSTSPTTYADFAKIVGKEVGKDIKLEQRSYMDAVSALLKVLHGTDDVHPTSRDTAQRMLLFYNYRGLVGNSNVLGWILGRKPTTIEEWARIKTKSASAL